MENKQTHPRYHDVFISYAKEDRERAREIAGRLERQGWLVFWDRTIPVGGTWDEILERELNGAKAVVVLWSLSSIASDWVRAEAEDAANRQVLVPAFLEAVKLPVRFRPLQAADLSDWIPSKSDTDGMQRLIEAISRLLTENLQEDTESTELQRLRKEMIAASSSHEMLRCRFEADEFVTRFPHNVEGLVLKRQIQDALEKMILSASLTELRKLRFEIDTFLSRQPESMDVHKLKDQIEKALKGKPGYFRLGIKQGTTRRIAAGLAVVAAAILVWFYQHKLPTSTHIESMAVLPLEDRNPDANTEYYRDGLTEEITRRLASLPNLRVPASSAVERFEKSPLSPQKIARELKVQAVVKCVMQIQGPNLKLYAQIFDTLATEPVWYGEKADSESRVFSVLDDISQDMASALNIRFTEADKIRFRRFETKDIAVYRLYLNGIFHAKKTRKGDNTVAMEYFSQALLKEPDYVPALVALADAQEYQYEREWSFDTLLLKQSELNCRKTLALDPPNAKAMAVLAAIDVMRGNTKTAIDWLQKAQATEPNNKLVLVRLGVLYINSEPAKAVTYLTEALNVDPTDADIITNLGIAYGQMKKYPEAIEQFLKAIQLMPDQSDLYINLGYAYMRIGRNDQAEKAFLTAHEKNPRDLRVYEQLTTLLLSKGEYAKAESLLVIGTRSLQNEPYILYMLGLTYDLWGRRASAHERYSEGLAFVEHQLTRDGTQVHNALMAGLFNARLGNISQARVYAQRAFTAGSTDSEVALKLARIYAVIGEHSEMLHAFERARESDEEYDLAYVSIALDFEKNRKDKDLLAIAREK